MQDNNQLSQRTVVVICFIVYFFSYAMRLDYSATIVPIVSDLKITNTLASYAVTGSFITYGTGQIICGIIADRISPVKLIKYAMIGTIAVNVLVSFCSNIVIITVFWSINGFCQAMIWPSLARFLLESVGKAKFSDSITIVGLSASIGTIFVYVFVPAVLKLTIWRNVFRCMSLFGIVILIVWCYTTRNVFMGKAVKGKENTVKENTHFLRLVVSAGLIPIFMIITLHGILRDGIQTWLPSLINERFGLSQTSSILSIAVLPLLSIFSVIFANFLFHKIKNELITSSIVFGAAFAATIPFVIGVKVSPVLTVCLACIISGCMHGVNLLLISLAPLNFTKYGLFATLTGINNSFSFVGASISSVGFAALADNVGWNAVQISWCVVAAIATLTCVLTIKRWTKFCSR